MHPVNWTPAKFVQRMLCQTVAWDHALLNCRTICSLSNNIALYATQNQTKTKVNACHFACLLTNSCNNNNNNSNTYNKNFLCICHLFLSKLLSAFCQQNRIENLNLPYLPTAKTELQKKLKNAVKIFSYTFRYSFHLPLFSLKNIYNKNRLSITDLKKTKTIEKTTNKQTKNQLTMKWISKNQIPTKYV